jgi:hypothetical protein
MLSPATIVRHNQASKGAKLKAHHRILAIHIIDRRS